MASNEMNSNNLLDLKEESVDIPNFEEDIDFGYHFLEQRNVNYTDSTGEGSESMEYKKEIETGNSQKLKRKYEKRFNYKEDRKKSNLAGQQNITTSMKLVPTKQEPTEEKMTSEDNTKTEYFYISPKEEYEDSQERTETQDEDNRHIENPEQFQEQVPDIWSTTQYRDFQEKYEWLIAANGKLGCKTCRKIKHFTSPTSRGVKIAIQWASYQISSYGKNKIEKLTSLRKKMFEHNKSKAHQEAQKIIDQSTVKKLQKLEIKTEDFETTNRIFRTAYYIAKNNIPNSDFEEIIDLQISNGADLSILENPIDIIEHIANQMRKNILSEIIKYRSKITIIIDESTTISTKPTLIIFLKCSIDGKIDPIVVFLDLLELDNTSAVYITEILLKCLDNHGLNEKFLSDTLISFCSDGADEILGIKSGIGTLLQQKFPNIILWNCINHRLELTVDHAFEFCGQTNDIKSFFDSLWHLQLTGKEFETKEIEISLKQINVFGLGWVSSSWRGVNAVWDSFSMLAQHLNEASIDINRDFGEKATFESLHKRLCSKNFIKNLGLMLDVLIELKNLTFILQQKNMTIPKADDTIKCFIKRIESLKTFPGDYSKKAQSAIEIGKFNDVELKYQGKYEININQFIEGVVEILNYKLLTILHKWDKNTEEQTGEKCKDLLRNMSFLDPEHWDEYENPHFGETEIADLANFLKTNKEGVKLGFIEYKQCAGRFIPETLKSLTRTVDTLAANNDCVEVFTCMNIIANEIRTDITVKHISDRMFISIIGPPLNDFNPLPYVKTWLEKDRQKDHLTEGMQDKKESDWYYDNLWKIL